MLQFTENLTLQASFLPCAVSLRRRGSRKAQYGTAVTAPAICHDSNLQSTTCSSKTRASRATTPSSSTPSRTWVASVTSSGSTSTRHAKTSKSSFSVSMWARKSCEHQSSRAEGHRGQRGCQGWPSYRSACHTLRIAAVHEQALSRCNGDRTNPRLPIAVHNFHVQPQVGRDPT